MVVEKVRKTIQQHKLIENGEHIVLGVSGGPDSVCLLSVLRELAEERGLTLHAVHINHCLREKDADADQHYTEGLCKNLGVPCHVFRYDVKSMAAEQKITSEEAGRNARYESFHRVKKEIQSSGIPKVKIAVAHNMNDQAETLLMRIIRGTGTDGLAGMEYVRDGVIIRPLLDVTRAEIEEYCRQHELFPRTDLTNLEPIYTRNRLRLELLPLLQSQYNENILSALNRLAQIAGEDKEYLYQQVDEAKSMVEAEGHLLRIPRKAYSGLHPAIGKRLVSASLKELGLIQDMTAVHLDGADRLLRNGGTGDSMDFPGGYGLRMTYDTGELFGKDSDIRGRRERKEGAAFRYPVRMNGITPIPELNALLKVKILQAGRQTKPLGENRFSACLDLTGKGTGNQAGNSVASQVAVRSRRPGDYIFPLGMKGTKKIQDFYVDEKIKREDRDKIPLLCLGSEVLWVVGYRISEKYKVTEETTEMVCIEYMPLL